MDTISTLERQQRLQRIRVGLTGLALVLLLLGLASAIFRSANNEAPLAVAGAVKPDVVANITNTTAPEGRPAAEPLAELGVAPGGAAEVNAIDSANAADAD